MRIGIVGVGLIGGSLGRALRAIGQSLEVMGVTRTADAAEQARAAGAVDEASTDASILDRADVVVIATPIMQIPDVLDRIGYLVNRGAVITDVASVKRPVREWVRRIPEPGLFLGGHPVAGKAQSGIGASDPGLFKDAPWIFTPLEFQTLRPFEPWVELVTAIGARPRFLTPEEHDEQIAFLSHLAFTISSVYAETVTSNADPTLGGTGYRGMTRLAEGDPTMYASIALENHDALLRAIDQFALTLQRFRDRIERQDAVRELFQVAGHASL
jgi:prephenate dehydrogenase